MNRLVSLAWRWLGGPPFAPALVPIGPSILRPATSSDYGIEQIIQDMRILLGVPKMRKSKARIQRRKFAWNRLLHPRPTIVCDTCGTIRAKDDTICRTCYEKVREKTNEIKMKMLSYNPFLGERQKKFPKFGDYAKEMKEKISGEKEIAEKSNKKPSWIKETIKMAEDQKGQ